MKLPILNLQEFSTDFQLAKILEEWDEFLEADNYIETVREGLDVIQAMLGYLMMLVPDANDQKIYVDEHYKKLQQRGWEFDGEVELKFKFK